MPLHLNDLDLWTPSTLRYQQKNAGRISNIARISKPLFKTHLDGFNNGYHKTVSNQLAIRLKRYIKSTEKHKRRTPQFVREIIGYLDSLHEYNLQVTKASKKNRYPRTRHFNCVLELYIGLECELLHSPNGGAADVPSSDQILQRILRVLNRLLLDAIHKDAQPYYKSTSDAVAKIILRLVNNVQTDCDNANNLVSKIILKLVQKIGIQSKIDKLKDAPVYLDKYFTDPLVTSLWENLSTNEYATDDSLSDDEEYPCSPDLPEFKTKKCRTSPIPCQFASNPPNLSDTIILLSDDEEDVSLATNKDKQPLNHRPIVVADCEIKSEIGESFQGDDLQDEHNSSSGTSNSGNGVNGSKEGTQGGSETRGGSGVVSDVPAPHESSSPLQGENIVNNSIAVPTLDLTEDDDNAVKILEPAQSSKARNLPISLEDGSEVADDELSDSTVGRRSQSDALLSEDSQQESVSLLEDQVSVSSFVVEAQEDVGTSQSESTDYECVTSSTVESGVSERSRSRGVVDVAESIVSSTTHETGCPSTEKDSTGVVSFKAGSSPVEMELHLSSTSEDVQESYPIAEQIAQKANQIARKLELKQNNDLQEEESSQEANNVPLSEDQKTPAETDTHQNDGVSNDVQLHNHSVDWLAEAERTFRSIGPTEVICDPGESQKQQEAIAVIDDSLETKKGIENDDDQAQLVTVFAEIAHSGSPGSEADVDNPSEVPDEQIFLEVEQDMCDMVTGGDNSNKAVLADEDLQSPTAELPEIIDAKVCKLGNTPSYEQKGSQKIKDNEVELDLYKESPRASIHATVEAFEAFFSAANVEVEVPIETTSPKEQPAKNTTVSSVVQQIISDFTKDDSSSEIEQDSPISSDRQTKTTVVQQILCDFTTDDSSDEFGETSDPVHSETEKAENNFTAQDDHACGHVFVDPLYLDVQEETVGFEDQTNADFHQMQDPHDDVNKLSVTSAGQTSAEMQNLEEFGTETNESVPGDTTIYSPESSEIYYQQKTDCFEVEHYTEWIKTKVDETLTPVCQADLDQDCNENGCKKLDAHQQYMKPTDMTNEADLEKGFIKHCGDTVAKIDTLVAVYSEGVADNNCGYIKSPENCDGTTSTAIDLGVQPVEYCVLKKCASEQLEDPLPDSSDQFCCPTSLVSPGDSTVLLSHDSEQNNDVVKSLSQEYLESQVSTESTYEGLEDRSMKTSDQKSCLSVQDPSQEPECCSIETAIEQFTDKIKLICEDLEKHASTENPSAQLSLNCDIAIGCDSPESLIDDISHYPVQEIDVIENVRAEDFDVQLPSEAPHTLSATDVTELRPEDVEEPKIELNENISSDYEVQSIGESQLSCGANSNKNYLEQPITVYSTEGRAQNHGEPLETIVQSPLSETIAEVPSVLDEKASVMLQADVADIHPTGSPAQKYGDTIDILVQSSAEETNIMQETIVNSIKDPIQSYDEQSERVLETITEVVPIEDKPDMLQGAVDVHTRTDPAVSCDDPVEVVIVPPILEEEAEFVPISDEPAMLQAPNHGHPIEYSNVPPIQHPLQSSDDPVEIVVEAPHLETMTAAVPTGAESEMLQETNSVYSIEFPVRSCDGPVQAFGEPPLLEIATEIVPVAEEPEMLEETNNIHPIIDPVEHCAGSIDSVVEPDFVEAVAEIVPLQEESGMLREANNVHPIEDSVESCDNLIEIVVKPALLEAVTEDMPTAEEPEVVQETENLNLTDRVESCKGSIEIAVKPSLLETLSEVIPTEEESEMLQEAENVNQAEDRFVGCSIEVVKPSLLEAVTEVVPTEEKLEMRQEAENVNQTEDRVESCDSLIEAVVKPSLPEIVTEVVPNEEESEILQDADNLNATEDQAESGDSSIEAAVNLSLLEAVTTVVSTDAESEMLQQDKYGHSSEDPLSSCGGSLEADVKPILLKAVTKVEPTTTKSEILQEAQNVNPTKVRIARFDGLINAVVKPGLLEAVAKVAPTDEKSEIPQEAKYGYSFEDPVQSGDDGSMEADAKPALLEALPGVEVTKEESETLQEATNVHPMELGDPLIVDHPLLEAVTGVEVTNEESETFQEAINVHPMKLGDPPIVDHPLLETVTEVVPIEEEPKMLQEASNAYQIEDPPERCGGPMDTIVEPPLLEAVTEVVPTVEEEPKMLQSNVQSIQGPAQSCECPVETVVEPSDLKTMNLVIPTEDEPEMLLKVNYVHPAEGSVEKCYGPIDGVAEPSILDSVPQVLLTKEEGEVLQEAPCNDVRPIEHPLQSCDGSKKILTEGTIKNCDSPTEAVAELLPEATTVSIPQVESEILREGNSVYATEDVKTVVEPPLLEATTGVVSIEQEPEVSQEAVHPTEDPDGPVEAINEPHLEAKTEAPFVEEGPEKSKEVAAEGKGPDHSALHETTASIVFEAVPAEEVILDADGDLTMLEAFHNASMEEISPLIPKSDVQVVTVHVAASSVSHSIEDSMGEFAVPPHSPVFVNSTEDFERRFSKALQVDKRWNETALEASRIVDQTVPKAKCKRIKKTFVCDKATMLGRKGSGSSLLPSDNFTGGTVSTVEGLPLAEHGGSSVSTTTLNELELVDESQKEVSVLSILAAAASLKKKLEVKDDGDLLTTQVPQLCNTPHRRPRTKGALKDMSVVSRPKLPRVAKLLYTDSSSSSSSIVTRKRAAQMEHKAKFRPHDFKTVQNSIVSPETKKVYERAEPLEPTITSDDSNDSGDAQLFIDEGTLVEQSKTDNTDRIAELAEDREFDGDTIDEDLEFFSSRNFDEARLVEGVARSIEAEPTREGEAIELGDVIEQDMQKTMLRINHSIANILSKSPVAQKVGANGGDVVQPLDLSKEDEPSVAPLQCLPPNLALDLPQEGKPSVLALSKMTDEELVGKGKRWTAAPCDETYDVDMNPFVQLERMRNEESPISPPPAHSEERTRDPPEREFQTGTYNGIIEHPDFQAKLPAAPGVLDLSPTGTDKQFICPEKVETRRLRKSSRLRPVPCSTSVEINSSDVASSSDKVPEPPEVQVELQDVTEVQKSSSEKDRLTPETFEGVVETQKSPSKKVRRKPETSEGVMEAQKSPSKKYTLQLETSEGIMEAQKSPSKKDRLKPEAPEGDIEVQSSPSKKDRLKQGTSEGVIETQKSPTKKDRLKAETSEGVTEAQKSPSKKNMLLPKPSEKVRKKPNLECTIKSLKERLQTKSPDDQQTSSAEPIIHDSRIIVTRRSSRSSRRDSARSESSSDRMESDGESKKKKKSGRSKSGSLDVESNKRNHDTTEIVAGLMEGDKDTTINSSETTGTDLFVVGKREESIKTDILDLKKNSKKSEPSSTNNEENVKEANQCDVTSQKSVVDDTTVVVKGRKNRGNRALLQREAETNEGLIEKRNNLKTDKTTKSISETSPVIAGKGKKPVNTRNLEPKNSGDTRKISKLRNINTENQIIQNEISPKVAVEDTVLNVGRKRRRSRTEIETHIETNESGIEKGNLTNNDERAKITSPTTVEKYNKSINIESAVPENSSIIPVSTEKDVTVKSHFDGILHKAVIKDTLEVIEEQDRSKTGEVAKTTAVKKRKASINTDTPAPENLTGAQKKIKLRKVSFAKDDTNQRHSETEAVVTADIKSPKSRGRPRVERLVEYKENATKQRKLPKTDKTPSETSLESTTTDMAEPENATFTQKKPAKKDDAEKSQPDEISRKVSDDTVAVAGSSKRRGDRPRVEKDAEAKERVASLDETAKTTSETSLESINTDIVQPENATVAHTKPEKKDDTQNNQPDEICQEVTSEDTVVVAGSSKRRGRRARVKGQAELKEGATKQGKLPKTDETAKATSEVSLKIINTEIAEPRNTTVTQRKQKKKDDTEKTQPDENFLKVVSDDTVAVAGGSKNLGRRTRLERRPDLTESPTELRHLAKAEETAKAISEVSLKSINTDIAEPENATFTHRGQKKKDETEKNQPDDIFRKVVSDDTVAVAGSSKRQGRRTRVEKRVNSKESSTEQRNLVKTEVTAKTASESSLEAINTDITEPENVTVTQRTQEKKDDTEKSQTDVISRKVGEETVAVAGTSKRRGSKTRVEKQAESKEGDSEKRNRPKTEKAAKSTSEIPITCTKKDEKSRNGDVPEPENASGTQKKSKSQKADTEKDGIGERHSVEEILHKNVADAVETAGSSKSCSSRTQLERRAELSENPNEKRRPSKVPEVNSRKSQASMTEAEKQSKSTDAEERNRSKTDETETNLKASFNPALVISEKGKKLMKTFMLEAEKLNHKERKLELPNANTEGDDAQKEQTKKNTFIDAAAIVESHKRRAESNERGVEKRSRLTTDRKESNLKIADDGKSRSSKPVDRKGTTKEATSKHRTSKESDRESSIGTKVAKTENKANSERRHVSTESSRASSSSHSDSDQNRRERHSHRSSSRSSGEKSERKRRSRSKSRHHKNCSSSSEGEDVRRRRREERSHSKNRSSSSSLSSQSRSQTKSPARSAERKSSSRDAKVTTSEAAKEKSRSSRGEDSKHTKRVEDDRKKEREERSSKKKSETQQNEAGTSADAIGDNKDEIKTSGSPKVREAGLDVDNQVSSEEVPMAATSECQLKTDEVTAEDSVPLSEISANKSLSQLALGSRLVETESPKAAESEQDSGSHAVTPTPEETGTAQEKHSDPCGFDKNTEEVAGDVAAKAGAIEEGTENKNSITSLEDILINKYIPVAITCEDNAVIGAAPFVPQNETKSLSLDDSYISREGATVQQKEEASAIGEEVCQIPLPEETAKEASAVEETEQLAQPSIIDEAPSSAEATAKTTEGDTAALQDDVALTESSVSAQYPTVGLTTSAENMGETKNVDQKLAALCQSGDIVGSGEEKSEAVSKKRKLSFSGPNSEDNSEAKRAKVTFDTVTGVSDKEVAAAAASTANISIEEDNNEKQPCFEPSSGIPTAGYSGGPSFVPTIREEVATRDGGVSAGPSDTRRSGVTTLRHTADVFGRLPQSIGSTIKKWVGESDAFPSNLQITTTVAQIVGNPVKLVESVVTSSGPRIICGDDGSTADGNVIYLDNDDGAVYDHTYSGPLGPMLSGSRNSVQQNAEENLEQNTDVMSMGSSSKEGEYQPLNDLEFTQLMDLSPVEPELEVDMESYTSFKQEKLQTGEADFEGFARNIQELEMMMSSKTNSPVGENDNAPCSFSNDSLEQDKISLPEKDINQYAVEELLTLQKNENSHSSQSPYLPPTLPDDIIETSSSNDGGAQDSSVDHDTYFAYHQYSTFMSDDSPIKSRPKVVVEQVLTFDDNILALKKCAPEGETVDAPVQEAPTVPEVKPHPTTPPPAEPAQVDIQNYLKRSRRLTPVMAPGKKAATKRKTTKSPPQTAKPTDIFILEQSPDSENAEKKPKLLKDMNDILALPEQAPVIPKGRIRVKKDLIKAGVKQFGGVSPNNFIHNVGSEVTLPFRKPSPSATVNIPTTTEQSQPEQQPQPRKRARFDEHGKDCIEEFFVDSGKTDDKSEKPVDQKSKKRKLTPPGEEKTNETDFDRILKEGTTNRWMKGGATEEEQNQNQVQPTHEVAATHSKVDAKREHNKPILEVSGKKPSRDVQTHPDKKPASSHIPQPVKQKSGKSPAPDPKVPDQKLKQKCSPEAKISTDELQSLLARDASPPGRRSTPTQQKGTTRSPEVATEKGPLRKDTNFGHFPGHSSNNIVQRKEADLQLQQQQNHHPKTPSREELKRTGSSNTRLPRTRGHDPQHQMRRTAVGYFDRGREEGHTRTGVRDFQGPQHHQHYQQQHKQPPPRHPGATRPPPELLDVSGHLRSEPLDRRRDHAKPYTSPLDQFRQVAMKPPPAGGHLRGGSHMEAGPHPRPPKPNNGGGSRGDRLVTLAAERAKSEEKKENGVDFWEQFSPYFPGDSGRDLFPSSGSSSSP